MRLKKFAAKNGDAHAARSKKCSTPKSTALRSNPPAAASATTNKFRPYSPSPSPRSLRDISSLTHTLCLVSIRRTHSAPLRGASLRRRCASQNVFPCCSRRQCPADRYQTKRNVLRVYENPSPADPFRSLPAGRQASDEAPVCMSTTQARQRVIQGPHPNSRSLFRKAQMRAE